MICQPQQSVRMAWDGERAKAAKGAAFELGQFPQKSGAALVAGGAGQNPFLKSSHLFGIVSLAERIAENRGASHLPAFCR